MPLRGSAQLLLLFLRSRSKRRWVGAIAGGAVAAGLFFGGSTLPTGTELAQLLRERAWDRALAEAPEPSPWPWSDSQSAAATAGKVHRLGLSAAVYNDATAQGLGAVYAPKPPAEAASHQNDSSLRELVVGDRITVTSASGTSRHYRVTGPKVVDPHLADGASSASGDASSDTCVPLDPLLARSLGLVIQSITADHPAHAPNEEQKL